MALRRWVLLFAMGAISGGLVWPCGAAEKKAEDKKEGENIWTIEPPGSGRPRLGLSDAEIDRIMKWIKANNPAKAKDLEALRKDKERVEEFLDELRNQGEDEYTKIFRERIAKYRQRRDAEFVEWAGKHYQREAKELAKAKANPELYDKKLRLLKRKYWRIYEASRRNPQLAEVLMKDLALKIKRDGLIEKIKGEKDDKKRRQLGAQLYETVADRFELIIKRKQITIAQLLKRLKDLQTQVSQSKTYIKEWRNEKNREAIIKERLEMLTKGIGKRPFKWD